MGTGGEVMQPCSLDLNWNAVFEFSLLKFYFYGIAAPDSPNIIHYMLHDLLSFSLCILSGFGEVNLSALDIYIYSVQATAKGQQ